MNSPIVFVSYGCLGERLGFRIFEAKLHDPISPSEILGRSLSEVGHHHAHGSFDGRIPFYRVQYRLMRQCGMRSYGSRLHPKHTHEIDAQVVSKASSSIFLQFVWTSSGRSLSLQYRRHSLAECHTFSQSNIMQYLTAFAALLGLAAATARTTAPSGALVVGSSGDYDTIQDAIDALDSSSSSEQSIFIQAGTYKEQVYIQALSGPLTIYGYTEDTSSYASNKVTVSSGLSQDDGLDNDGTATLRVWTSDFKLYNVNVENTYGEGSQALALSASAGVS